MAELSVKGIQKTSLVDYPGKVVATLFLDSCNFRCPFCHNKDLVIDPDSLTAIKPREIITFLKSKDKWLDGVCITGGEPTLHKGLPNFIKKIKDLGFLVKLDTNGSNPKMLKEILQSLDFVSMDIKAPLEKYDLTTRVKTNKKDIQESIDLLKNNKVKYEFRTTVVPGLFDKEDAKNIGKWLKGSKKYAIQNFKPGNNVIDNNYKNKKPFSKIELDKFKSIVEKYIENVEIRGI